MGVTTKLGGPDSSLLPSRFITSTVLPWGFSGVRADATLGFNGVHAKAAMIGDADDLSLVRRRAVVGVEWQSLQRTASPYPSETFMPQNG